MDTIGQSKWNARYVKPAAEEPAAAEVLVVNQHLLPATGVALDLACGRGGNALLLARSGLNTHAWDFSEVVLKQLNAVASNIDVTLTTQTRDVVQVPPHPKSFDVVVVSRFLDRTLFPHLIETLLPGGLIFYQTFSRDKINDQGPSNPDYLLDTNELLTVFNRLTILAYRDEGLQGNTDVGFRNESWIVAKKGV